MIIIYDFDGTLTPYPLPQYEILKKCRCTENTLIERIKKELNSKKDAGLYETFYKCFRDILSENQLEMSINNVCLGANQVQFNNGVLEYFKRFQNSKTGVKHYIVTSGMKCYVEKTIISPYLDGIYGVTFEQKNEILGNIKFLMTDKKKVDIIKKIRSENNETNQIIYFGDGLTDQYAFEYVHSIGGKNVFIAANEQSMLIYNKLNTNGIIDECFNASFENNSEVSNYIQQQI